MNILGPSYHWEKVLAIIAVILTFVFTIGYHFVLQKANNPEGNE